MKTYFIAKQKQNRSNKAKATHSVKEALVVGKYVITARANMYVDMAIAIGKKMNLFVDEADLQEAIDFWKLHKTSY